jgi:2-C-methyl-D-erythritol 4-phosphate cytidylyltransferase
VTETVATTADAGHPRSVVAVVLAGGVGTRIGADRPKQLLRIAGRTILEWAVSAFHDSPCVDDVWVVTAGTLVDDVRDLLATAGLGDVRVIEGGVLRTDSTRAAITALGDSDCDVLLHDAARPLVDGRIIADCVRALRAGEAVTTAVSSMDTVAEVEPDGRVKAILDRARLRNVQTPQGFRLATIRAAYRLMDADPHGAPTATDDCCVVLRYLPNVPIGVVPGSARNLKVTHPDDLLVAERLLSD